MASAQTNLVKVFQQPVGDILRYISRKYPLDLRLAQQAIRHAVKSLDQITDFIIAALLDTHAQITLIDRLRRRHQAVNR